MPLKNFVMIVICIQTLNQARKQIKSENEHKTKDNSVFKQIKQQLQPREIANILNRGRARLHKIEQKLQPREIENL